MPDINDPPEEFRLSCHRVRKKFSARENDEYIIAAFKYIKDYFKNKMNEIQESGGIEAELMISENYRFESVIYEDGALVSECRIWLSKGGPGGMGKEIKYSSKLNEDSWNESIYVEDDGYAQFFKPTLMILGSERGDLFRMDGAAEYFWTIFEGPLE